MSASSFLLKNQQTLQKTLQQILPPSEVSLPVQIQLTENHLLIAEQEKAPGFTDIELVVFADLSVENLSTMLAKMSFTSCLLTDINHRVEKTSYRFSIQLSNEQAYVDLKTVISDYAQAQAFEAALLKQAPALDTPGLLLMDMDSTTIEIECIDEIAKLAGVGEQVSEVTELAMQGKLDFAESLRARVATLKDAPQSILAQVGDNLPLMPGLVTLVTELHAKQWKVAVASGGFTYFTEILKEQLNLDATQANVLEIIDGKLTGKVVGDITDAQVKADTLLALAEQFNIEHPQTVAMGDGANDLTMMAASHLGVAYKAKPIVRQKAQSSINYSGLDCLLHWLR